MSTKRFHHTKITPDAQVAAVRRETAPDRRDQENARTSRQVARLTCRQTEQFIQERWLAPEPDGVLKQIAQATWTAHNIPVGKDRSTLFDPQRPLIEDEPRTRAIKRNLALFSRPAADPHSPYSGRLIDLGCLEGGLSFEMARAGFDVLGVEGRESNYEKCKLIEEFYQLPNLRFQHLDVKDLHSETHGIFDAVVCCGLLYHLDNPAAFLHRLFSITHSTSVLFLDTHVAPPSQTLERCVFRDSLSDVDEIIYAGSIYPGRWYSEYSEDGHSDDAWASVSNHRSFWPTQEALIRALADAGFHYVYDIHGSTNVREEAELKSRYSRLYLIALKQDYFLD